VSENQTVDDLIEDIEKNLEDDGILPRQQKATTNRSGFCYSQRPFESPSKDNTPYPSTQGKPLPHQPKGRLLTTLVIVSVLAIGGFQIWNSFFRYSAYGVFDAHVVDVATPMNGIVLGTHVREGDNIRQGQLIVTIHDLVLQHRLASISDELRESQANLSAEMAKLQWQIQIQMLEKAEYSAEYLEAAARLEQEIATQKNADNGLTRAHKAHAQEAITREEFERIFHFQEGQTEKVSRLREALNLWKKRTDLASISGNRSIEQIDPMLARINSLQGELRRVRESLKQGEVRSPVNGRISRWHVRAGEYASKSNPLFSVVEDGSIHVKLHLPQHSINRFTVGDDVNLEVSFLSKQMSFTVDRLGDDLETPPHQIERFYSPDEKLQPVYLSLKNASLRNIRIPLGSQVRYASEWFVDK
jgi:multidrug resistance efflux pump